MKAVDTENLSRYSEEKDELTAIVSIKGSLGKTSDGRRVDSLKVKVPAKLGEILLGIEQTSRVELRRDSMLVLINGVEASALEDLETLVVANDNIVLLPMFHGGR